ncbi:MAG: type II toxin-antitoxin system mRNA interferase toxin, RelE/StbE family [Actinobacteria bacterium]|nr:type II toxin-antitoxin system mRNA interferase toxin, RelE/StbE family [Actinomycetota bacterium]
MKINRSSRFKRSFKKLPPRIQKDFDRKIKIFFDSPFAPFLRTHKLRGNLADYYTFCLKDGYRVLFDFVSENTVVLVNIGSHNDYGKWGR